MRKPKWYSNPLVIAGILWAFLATIWWLTPSILPYIFQIETANHTNLGAFGDMFGSINALFSSLAFGTVAITLFFQSFELKAQREALKIQKDELINQREELKNQRLEHEENRIANILYKQIELFLTRIELTKLKITDPEPISLRDGYHKANHLIIDAKIHKWNASIQNSSLISFLQSNFFTIYEFFNLYLSTKQIIYAMIEDSNIEEKEKFKYKSIFISNTLTTMHQWTIAFLEEKKQIKKFLRLSNISENILDSFYERVTEIDKIRSPKPPEEPQN